MKAFAIILPQLHSQIWEWFCLKEAIKSSRINFHIHCLGVKPCLERRFVERINTSFRIFFYLLLNFGKHRLLELESYFQVGAGEQCTELLLAFPLHADVANITVSSFTQQYIFQSFLCCLSDFTMC